MKQIKPWRLFHCQFETNHDLTMTFVRLQEFYESPNPKIRGKYFTFEEYVDWYARTQGEGNFTYLTDWTGFNVPGNVVQNFAIEIDDREDVRDRELRLFNALAHAGVDVWQEDVDPFYVIGTTLDCPLDTVDHEVRHAIYYLEEGYRREITQEIKRKKLAGLYKALDTLGYARKVHIDEAQAYILTGLDEDTMKETQEIRDLRKKLKKIEKKYIGV